MPTNYNNYYDKPIYKHAQSLKNLHSFNYNRDSQFIKKNNYNKYYKNHDKKLHRPATGNSTQDQHNHNRPASSDKFFKPEKQTHIRTGMQGYHYKADYDALMKRKNQRKRLQKAQKNQGKSSEANEYKKLQQKLSYLQTKITSIKNNIQASKVRRQTGIKKSQSQAVISMNKFQYPKQQKRVQKKYNVPQTSKAQKKINLNKYVTQVSKGIIDQLVNNSRNQKVQDPYSPRKPHLYYISQIIKAFICNQGLQLAKDHLNQTLNYLSFMKVIKKPSLEQLRQKISFAPKIHSGTIVLLERKTIIFDLDQTLIHCNQSIEIAHDITLPITFPTGEIIDAGINIRPYARQILKRLSYNFQIIVFTASHSCYANKVIDYLDPQKRVSARYFRENCYNAPQGLYIKDLRILNRNMADIVLVDNAVYSYYFQQQNGIPIIPYYQGKNDFQLQHLASFLQKMIQYKDVRQYTRKYLKIQRYNKYQDPIRLIRQLYPQWVQLYQR